MKIAKNRTIAISRNNNDLTARTLIQSLQVWQYTVHCSNSRFSICCLCPNDKEISISNESTSTLGKHLITKHQLHELALPSKKRKRVTSSFDNNKKENLHDLFIKCIIRDGTPFNDLQKPGLKLVLLQFIPG